MRSPFSSGMLLRFDEPFQGEAKRLEFAESQAKGQVDLLPTVERRSYGASQADLLQGLHRLRGGAGAAGRCEQPRTLTGELPAESVCLIAR